MLLIIPMIQFTEVALWTNSGMGRDYKDVVTKQLEYTPKRKVEEENQDWTDATNVDKNWTHWK